MSWKPCRGGRVLLDKYTEQSHSYYFKFYEATTIKEQSKCLFKILQADEYLGRLKQTVKIFEYNIKELTNKKDVYKPLLKYALHEKTT